METIILKLENFFFNILTWMVNHFICRNKNIWLFGASMGNRFADNSRYLFLYLSDHKDDYGLKELIWVTDNDDVITSLADKKYHVIKKKSLSSLYWHFKAGVHVVSNYYCSTGKQKGDILGRFSAGAIKIQLWHGVGIKAVGLMRTSLASNPYSLKNKIRYHILYYEKFLGNKIFTPGCWSKRYHLATSQENKRVSILDGGVHDNRVILGNYPRICDYVKPLEKEQIVIEELKKLKDNRIAILYCPTFRELKQEQSSYINPIDNEDFRDFLLNNNILWVEKRHFASSFHFENLSFQNAYYIDSDFDINLVYDSIDILLTDFSSAASDCLFKNKKILSYIPDYDDYITKERGFVNKYDLYFPGIITKNLYELKIGILDTINPGYFTEARKVSYSNCRNLLYGNNTSETKSVVDKILIAINAC